MPKTTVLSLLRYWSTKLRPLFPGEESRSWIEARVLFAYVLKKDREWFIAHGNENVGKKMQTAFEALTKKRLAHTPLAYLTGSKYFYGREFIVNKHVLIPRLETEILVDQALSTIVSPKQTLLWDVGTGSGAIAITCAKEKPSLTVIASDVSQSALRVATKNAKRMKVKVTFIKANLFSSHTKSILRRKRYDHLVVVANLPYLPMSDKKKLDVSVTKYEPMQALFTDDGGQFLNKKLLVQLSKLKRPMTIFCEIDPPQASSLMKFAKREFPQAVVSVIKDQFNRKRMLKIIK